jgi:hypothetical protein
MLGAPDVYISFKMDEEAKTDEKLTQLETYVRDIRVCLGRLLLRLTGSTR